MCFECRKDAQNRITLRLEYELRRRAVSAIMGSLTSWESNPREKQTQFMAGVKGRSGPPGNQNNFKHGLSVIDKNRRNGSLTGRESRIKAEVRDGLIADRGGENKVSTAEKVLVELISSDVAWLTTIDTAIRKVLKLNKRARANPKALKQLDDYKRPIVN